jgi:hypothetical protein
MINFSCKLSLATLVALLSTPSAPNAFAQEEAAPKPPKAAMIRGWMFPDQAKSSAPMVFKVSDQGQPQVLATSDGTNASLAGGYQSLAGSGKVVLELGAGDKPVFSQTLALQQGKFYTLVAWQQQGVWKVKAFVDQRPGPADSDRPLRVLNFTDRRETEVALGASAAKKISSGGIEEFRVPPKVDTVTAKVFPKDSGGVAATTTVEIDMSAMLGAYVVISPDYRGRMRPRVIAGGEVVEAIEVVPEGAEGQL